MGRGTGKFKVGGGAERGSSGWLFQPHRASIEPVVVLVHNWNALGGRHRQQKARSRRPAARLHAAPHAARGGWSRAHEQCPTRLLRTAFNLPPLSLSQKSTASDMDSILPLSVRGKLPTPVTKSPPPRADSAEDELLEGGSPRSVGAAYQALPVTGDSLITHNYTPALPVLDADELGKEVREKKLKG